MAQIGQGIDGKFRIVKLIGRGGMSRVYLARDIHLDKKWVVKEIRRSSGGKENTFLVEAALSEADIIKSLDHPAIVRIVDIAQDRMAVYIVEDYVKGISLKAYTDRFKDAAALPEAVLKDWAIQLCHVLIYLHGRRPPVIFRDIKPENVILTPSGHLKLVDFGIARRYRPDKSRDTVYLGTELYAAPEQYEESGMQTDMRTDIYGLGKTLQYLVRYCDPSDGLRRIIARCIRPDPDERYQDAKELLEELEQYEEIQKKRTGRNRRRKWLGAAAAAGMLLMACLFLGPRLSGDHEKEHLMEMLGTIKEKEVLTGEEEEKLLNLLMPHLREWKEEEGFEQTAFEIGMLYREYYAYGPDHAAGEIASVPWFVLARRYDPMAQVYELIGKTREMIVQMEPVPFVQVRSLLAHAQEETVTEPLRIQICTLAADSLRAGMEQYHAEGVTAQDIQGLLDRIGSLQDAPEEPESLVLARAAAERVYGE